MAEHFELIVFGLLVAGLVLLSDVLEVPYPIFLVLGELVLGFIPGVPEVKLAPELVLLRGPPAGRGIERASAAAQGARPLAPLAERCSDAYSGMRGAVSLAAALALPVEFPGRDLVLFLTFCVIFVTLWARV